MTEPRDTPDEPLPDSPADVAVDVTVDVSTPELPADSEIAGEAVPDAG